MEHTIFTTIYIPFIVTRDVPTKLKNRYIYSCDLGSYNDKLINNAFYTIKMLQRSQAIADTSKSIIIG